MIKNLEYSLLEENLFHSDIGTYKAYGLAYKGIDGSISISDISTCRQKVEDMLKLFTKCKLHPVHLHEVIENLLS